MLNHHYTQKADKLLVILIFLFSYDRQWKATLASTFMISSLGSFDLPVLNKDAFVLFKFS